MELGRWKEENDGDRETNTLLKNFNAFLFLNSQ